MAYDLEFWVADGNGEALDLVIRCAAWELISVKERYLRTDHVYIILKRTWARHDSWIVWIKHGYTSGTQPTLGKLKTIN